MNTLSQDDPEVKPELPDYLAALHACEVREVHRISSLCAANSSNITLAPKGRSFGFFSGLVILLLKFTQIITMACFCMSLFNNCTYYPGKRIKQNRLFEPMLGNLCPKCLETILLYLLFL